MVGIPVSEIIANYVDNMQERKEERQEEINSYYKNASKKILNREIKIKASDLLKEVENV